MFKFKGISSKDMQVIIEEEEHFIARAAQRYEITEIDGKDGAIYDELGYSVVERPIYVQCLNIDKIDEILAWLNGEGEFEYKGRKTIARFYSELDPLRSSCIRIIDTTFIRDPFWYKANETLSLVKDRKDKTVLGQTIYISDSTEAKITELNIKGNSRQKTRNGKNLLELQEGTYTNNGITAVVKNGIITLNGTATETVPIYINLKTTVTALANILYTLSINNEKTIGDSNNFCALRINNDGQKQALLHNKNATYLQGNTTDTEITYITIRIASGTTFSNFEIKPQLELGNVASNWEQGGIAPGPDYHSEIESCGDNINLFDGEYYDGKGYNTNTGALETNANLYCNKNYINILGGQRKISLSKNGVGKNTRFFFYNSNKQYISTATGEKNVEIPENAIYLNFQITKSVIDNEMSNIKVEKGEPTSYSKNGQGLVNIKIGNENMLDIIENTYSENGITATVKEGIITLNGTATSTSFIYINLKTPITALANILYTLSTNNEKTIGDNNNYCAVRLNNDGQKQALLHNKNATYLQGNTTDTEITYITIRIASGTTLSNFIIKPKFERNNVATTYEKHQSQSYTIPVQEEMLEEDTFDLNNEEEVHTWDKYIITGDENWKKHNSTNNNSFYWEASEIITNILTPKNNDEKGIIKNTHFKSYDVNNIVFNNIIGTGLAVGTVFYISTGLDGISTISDFKQWLKTQYGAGTPVTIYYKLAQEKRIAFTQEQKEIAKQIKNKAKTYKKITHIYSTDKISPNMKVSYLTLTNEKINNQGNIQSRPILRLEKTIFDNVELTINNCRFKCTFNGDRYIEIDCDQKTIKYEGLDRNRNIKIGYDFPKLNVGENKIIIHEGDCIIKILRKDRWL